MTRTAKTRVAFVGCGYTQPTRTAGASDVDLAIEAARMAIEDAGISPADIDGLNVQIHHDPPLDTRPVLEALGLPAPRWERAGGGLGVLPAGIAAEAIDRGECNAVLVLKIVNTVGAIAAPQIDPITNAVKGSAQFDVPYGLGYSMQRIGLVGRRYMEQYGVTQEQIGTIAIVQREHALLNPWAVMKSPLTMEEYLNSRVIAAPVRLFDCDMPINGACATIMAREDIARGGKHAPVFFQSWASSGSNTQDHLVPELTSDMAPYAEEMYRDAGMDPGEMDLWYMYDGFSYFVPIWMEYLGLVPRGEGGNYVAGGTNIALTGAHPLNTHGGQLSEGRFQGEGHLLEAVQQLRGTAGPRQVNGARTAIVSSVTPATGGAGILTVN